MSNDGRNMTMVVCIIAVIAVGAIAVGALASLGTSGWFGFGFGPYTDFTFDRDEASMPAVVTLEIDVGAGGVNIQFAEDMDLLYDIDIRVENSTLTQHGEPTVVYSSDTITVDYPAARVNVTLGTGTTYVIDVNTRSGGISTTIDVAAQVGNITLATSAGDIGLVATDAVVWSGNVTIDLSATTGGISVDVDLPAGVGGRFGASVTTGAIDVDSVTWTEVLSNFYETSNYLTASQRVAILAQTTAGGISADLS
ncbi:MAG: hypothetical protein JSW61_01740 [Candidatus Thorarchaeota archaeon]|nr:MAG: hypothetical protein JSW61_01740 [Candidatus Thorarchaeota archaeon]